MAKMILGTYLTDPAEQEKLYKEAYRLNPKIKVLNLMLGKIAMSNNRNAGSQRIFPERTKTDENAREHTPAWPASMSLTISLTVQPGVYSDLSI